MSCACVYVTVMLLDTTESTTELGWTTYPDTGVRKRNRTGTLDNSWQKKKRWRLEAQRRGLKSAPACSVSCDFIHDEIAVIKPKIGPGLS